jgi:tetratricopeptide (TPR) repeat protein
MSQSADYGGGGRTGYPGGGPVTAFFTMLPVFVHYAGMVAWPATLSVVYAPEVKTAIDREVMAAALLLVGFAGVAFVACRRQRELFFWVTAIPIGLLPVAQLVPLVTFMNDRYLYFPMLGVAACSGFLAQKMFAARSRWRTPVTVTCICLLSGYAVVAATRTAVWRTSESLWLDAAVKQPQSAVAWHMLGYVYEKSGRTAESIASEERARTLCRGNECGLVLRKLSGLYLRENRLDRAAGSIDELVQRFPQVAEGHALRGHLFYRRGDLSAAEKSLLQAERLDPRLMTALLPLGNIYLATGRPALAIEKFRQVLALDTLTAELAYSMACAEAMQGNRRSALNYLDQSLRLGYNRPETIRANPELASLRNDREFRQLLEKYSVR